ncbi:hypothetical protein B4120_3739 [Bacillus cereus]|nr:hypothetical protein B4120_3739 [Bacillus cereus]
MEAKKEAKKTKILFSIVNAFISVRGYTYQFNWQHNNARRDGIYTER